MFEGLGVIAAIIILLIIFSEKSGGGEPRYERELLGINPNTDGSFTVYDKKTQSELFTGSFEECHQWIEEHA